MERAGASPAPTVPGLALALVLTLTACGKKEEVSEEKAEESSEEMKAGRRP